MPGVSPEAHDPFLWLFLALNASLVSCHLSHGAAARALSQGLLPFGVTQNRPSGTYGVTEEEVGES